MKPNIGIIIQARNNSLRFPNKLFYKIKDKTLIEILILKLKKIKFKKKIIIATTKDESDDIFNNIAKKWMLEYLEVIQKMYLVDIKKFQKKTNFLEF